jgi:Phage head-tail joining protein.
MRAGDLRTHVAWCKAIHSYSESGDEVMGYDFPDTIRVGLISKSGGIGQVANAQSDSIALRFNCRRSLAVKRQDRIIYRGEHYRVVDVAESAELAMLTVNCELEFE